MKRLVKKNLTMLLVAIAFVSLACFSVVTFKTTAKAESEWQSGVFEMEDGVALKYGQEMENGGGMRFVVKMEKSVYLALKSDDSAEFGVVIAPKELMLEANGDYLNMPKKIGGTIDKNRIYQLQDENADKNYYFANACITSIKLANLERDFVAVAYIKNGSEVRYTEYNDDARNNLYDLVNMAMLGGYAEEIATSTVKDGTSAYLQLGVNNGWFGSSEYPIVVESNAELEMVETISKNQNLSNCNVVLSDAVTKEPAFENEKIKDVFYADVYTVNQLIAELPDSITMPDAIGQIARIRKVERLYNVLSDVKKNGVTNYAKVESLLSSIEDYDRVYKNDEIDGTVVASKVPNFTATVGGSATAREDDVYGNVLTVKSDASGKAQLSYVNFPSLESYSKVYFYVRVLGFSCDLYLSDGTSNDGWGDNWRNTWSTSGFWCNADNWRLFEVNLTDGNVNNDYIGNNFAIGFRTNNTGFTFEVSDFYGVKKEVNNKTALTFGTQVDSGETNENGVIYNISREQWYIDNNNYNTIGTLQKSKLANALPSGYEHFYFYMYNGTGADYNFHLAGDCSGAWTDSKDSTALVQNAWTKIVISAEDIELNKLGQWYVYILGGDNQGAAKDGWKISPIYAGPVIVDDSYLDHADVKEVISLINAIPSTVTESDRVAIENARKAYDLLTSAQQSQVSNFAKLESAENALEDIDEANKVIELINNINPNNVDETLVANARTAYNGLTDSQKSLVTNIATLESYEETIKNESDRLAKIKKVNDTIANLPDSVIMPDHLVFVSRIENANSAYNALSDEDKGSVTNYAKLRSLVKSIKGYETVHVQSVDSVNVIPSHVPNYTSTIGGTATMGYDAYYGDYLRVTPNAGGKVAIQFKNFPGVECYEKLYFNIRVVGESCNIYLSDGTTNNGWGEGWHNTWSMDGFWTNNGNWIQKEVETSTGIFTANWALGLRADATGVSFEITNIVGVKPDLGEETNVSFGNFSDSGAKNLYGTVYNFTQGWGSETDLGAFNKGILNSALKEGHDALRFFIYNPNESDVVFYVNENETWIQTELATLKAKAWTEVVLTPAVIESNNTYLTYICVKSGAGTSGWQISPIYSFSSTDAVEKVQARINALNTDTPDEYQVNLAREEYEKLNEGEKALIDNEKLVTCEEKLYGATTEFDFIVDGETSYKIFYESAYKAEAEFMQEHIYNATGVTVVISSAKPVMSNYRYAIVLGYRELFESLNYDEGVDGRADYAIRSNGRAVCIVANSKDGYRLATIKFLNEVVGYDMMAEDCVIYGQDGKDCSTVNGRFNIVGDPFDYRQKQTVMTDAELYGMGMQSNKELWVHSNQGWDMHNTLHYLPTATYQSAHPSWYYTYTDTISVERTQICPTAGGTASEFNAMVNAIATNMLVQINALPDRENISFSIMDTGDGDDCQCARCKLYDTLYGEGGFAAAWIDLMNAVNAKVRESLPEGKVLNIAFLAYRGTEKAPANIDANGNVTLMKRYQINDNGSYTQTSEDLKCNEGVTVWLAPINAKYAVNFNHDNNAEHLATVKKWCAISSSVYLWMYGTNFKFYMYPYNSWKASAENYKIFKDLGVKSVWSQSNETEATAFSDLKSYIDSKFMVDVNANYETVLTNYFNGYFGPASEVMRSMFDKIVAKCEEIANNYSGLGRGIYDEIENTSGFLGLYAKTYWSKEWIDELVTLCDQAKELVDADGSLSGAQKTAIKNRITKESLFPRYVLCTTFASKYTTSNRNKMRENFKDDATALGFTLYREADGSLSGLYSDWGI